jgi:CRP-like cAMP-binding protein
LCAGTGGAIRRRIIIHAGESSATQYYITGGSVSIMIEHNDGNEVVLPYLNRGDFFGEIGMFESGQRTALVVAKEESEVVEMNYTKFHQLTQSDPEILFKLAAQMVGVYSRQGAAYDASGRHRSPRLHAAEARQTTHGHDPSRRMQIRTTRARRSPRSSAARARWRGEF